MRVVVCGDRNWGECTCHLVEYPRVPRPGPHAYMDSSCPVYRRHADPIFAMLEGLYQAALVNYDMEAPDGPCYPSPENPSGECSHEEHYALVVIEGGAKGADAIAKRWAERQTSILHLPFPADWATYGKSAGPVRNQQMIEVGKPDIVLAYHSDIATSRGTANMIAKARQHSIPVYLTGVVS